MTLKEFLRQATKKERAEVAVACNRSVGYLYQIAGRHRHASPLLAIRIEQLTRRVAAESRGRLEPVLRTNMVRHPEIFNEAQANPAPSVLGKQCG